MSAMPHADGERALDRLRELANIGAGHAAGALAQLIGRPIRMRVPRVQRDGPPGPAAAAVWFEVSGGLGGRLAVTFPDSELDAILEAMLGAPEPDRAGQAESALAEAGNILASHALSAVADVLGAAVLPSVPHLEMGAAPRGAERGVPLRIETDLVDTDGELRGVLVWIPASPGPW